jgi:hypothetical protein
MKTRMMLALAVLCAVPASAWAQTQTTTKLAPPGEKGSVLTKTREMIKLGTTKDPDAKVDLFLSGAEVRRKELEALNAKGVTTHNDALTSSLQKHLDGAAKTIEQGAAGGRDMTGAVGRYSTATSKHLVVLEGLLSKVPPQARKGILNAIEHSQHGHEEAIAAHQRGQAAAKGNPHGKGNHGGGKPEDGQKGPGVDHGTPGNGTPDHHGPPPGKGKGKGKSDEGDGQDSDRGPDADKGKDGDRPHGPPPGNGKDGKGGPPDDKKHGPPDKQGGGGGGPPPDKGGGGPPPDKGGGHGPK